MPGRLGREAERGGWAQMNPCTDSSTSKDESEQDFVYSAVNSFLNYSIYLTNINILQYTINYNQIKIIEDVLLILQLN